MVKQFLIGILSMLTLFFISRCCNSGNEPSSPYGSPDNTSRYEGSGGYRSIDYTYYCHNGRYVSVSYVRADDCSDYKKDSEFTSDGICGNVALDLSEFNILTVDQQLHLLEITGFKIDTLLFHVAQANSEMIVNP